MKEVYVVADNVISPLGFNTSDNFKQLLAANTAIVSHTLPAASPLPFFAALLNKSKLDTSFEGDASSYSYFEKLCINSISNALSQAKINYQDSTTLLIISTTKGNVDLLLSNPFEAKRVYLHESAKQIQHYFKLKNTPLIVSNACISGVVALNTAAELLNHGIYKHCIVVGADVVSEFTLSGFETFKALSPGPCKPFDAQRNGTSLGEGAATLILSTQHKSKLKILSGASSNDANHISGPSRDGVGLFIAVNKTMQAHQLPKIDFISAHGTGTIYNDEMESKAFNLAGLNQVPVNSLKGFFGHTFGAAGIIESAITLESMRRNCLIPTLGFETKDAGINLNIIKKAENQELHTSLKTASGFGGCNAAVMFQKVV